MIRHFPPVSRFKDHSSVSRIISLCPPVVGVAGYNGVSLEELNKILYRIFLLFWAEDLGFFALENLEMVCCKFHKKYFTNSFIADIHVSRLISTANHGTHKGP